MLSPGLHPPPIPTQHPRVHRQLGRQPGHHHTRSRRHVIGHEPQPRQRTQRHRQPQPIRRTPTPTRINKRDIRRRQREEPKQLLPINLRETPQAHQFLIREHPRRQTNPQPAPNLQPKSLPSHIRPKFSEYYGDPDYIKQGPLGDVITSIDANGNREDREYASRSTCCEDLTRIVHPNGGVTTSDGFFIDLPTGDTTTVFGAAIVQMLHFAFADAITNFSTRYINDSVLYSKLDATQPSDDPIVAEFTWDTNHSGVVAEIRRNGHLVYENTAVSNR